MAWVYTLSCAGSAGKISNLNFNLTSADYATAVTDASTILAAFQAVSAANVQKGRLSEVTEYPVSLPAGVDTAIIGTISGKINGSQKGVTVNFPAPKDSVRLGTEGDDYNELDLADATILAYWALFDTTGEATISDGESVSATPRSSQIVSKSSRNP